MTNAPEPESCGFTQYKASDDGSLSVGNDTFYPTTPDRFQLSLQLDRFELARECIASSAPTRPLRAILHALTEDYPALGLIVGRDFGPCDFTVAVVPANDPNTPGTAALFLDPAERATLVVSLDPASFQDVAGKLSSRRLAQLTVAVALSGLYLSYSGRDGIHEFKPLPGPRPGTLEHLSFTEPPLNLFSIVRAISARLTAAF